MVLETKKMSRSEKTLSAALFAVLALSCVNQYSILQLRDENSGYKKTSDIQGDDINQQIIVINKLNKQLESLSKKYDKQLESNRLSIDSTRYTIDRFILSHNDLAQQLDLLENRTLIIEDYIEQQTVAISLDTPIEATKEQAELVLTPYFFLLGLGNFTNTTINENYTILTSQNISSIRLIHTPKNKTLTIQSLIINNKPVEKWTTTAYFQPLNDEQLHCYWLDDDMHWYHYIITIKEDEI